MRASFHRFRPPALDRIATELDSLHSFKAHPLQQSVRGGGQLSLQMVLFPAYMWHGVEPFRSDQPCLSVAFDVVPG